MIRLRPWQLLALLSSSLLCIAAAPLSPVASDRVVGSIVASAPLVNGSQAAGSRIAAARDAVLPYVVSILTVSQSFQQGEPTLSLSSGSGTIITAEGDVVTNAHVVELPVLASATGPWIGLHGGVRWSDAAMSGEPLVGPSDRALFLSITLAWHQLFLAHAVDAGDRAPR